MSDYKVQEIQFDKILKNLDFSKLSEDLFLQYRLPSYYLGDTFVIPNTLVPELRAAQQHLQNVKNIKTTNLSFADAKEAMYVLGRLREIVDGLIKEANERLIIEEV